MSLIEVKDLTIAYRTPEGEEFEALKSVSFALGAGETLGIIGESGCGKSTLSRALLGHLRPGSFATAGTVALNGQNLLAASPDQLRAIRSSMVALVPQQPLSSLTPHLRVGDQVAEVIMAHRASSREGAEAEVIRQFERTRLPEPQTIGRRYPHELSGGQRQRVAIAAALAGAPKLLVLDEPTTAIDKTTEVDVLALVNDLRIETGAALIYVSHDLRVIREMCRRVLVMKAGRIVEDADVNEVFRSPRTAYTRQLLDAIPDLDRLAARPAAAVRIDAPALLEVDRLSFAYPAGRTITGLKHGPRVLHDVSFSIAKGGSFGLVGESGSGKSTIAGLVAGLLDGGEGRMRFNGASLDGRARRRSLDLRRRIQLVFQDPLSALNPAHTVESLISRPMRRFFSRSRSEARAETLALMGAFDLDARLIDRRPSELSGGQQQRVALARALAAQPDLIVCDEVTSALDVTVQAQLVALLNRLRRERAVTFLYISHDLGFIGDVADTVMVLQRGEAREAGPTPAVFANPSHAYTRALVEAYRGRAMPLRDAAE
jgi:peptide/nickel transport system ATP-binding protein